MNLKLLTDYERMLLGITRESGERHLQVEPVTKSPHSPLWPSTSDGRISLGPISGASTDSETTREYLNYLNNLIKRGVVF